jgi:hypothetical protein
MANRVNLTAEHEWHRYEHKYWDIPIVDSAGAAVDLTGVNLRLVLLREQGSTAELREKTTADAITVTGDEDDTARIEWGSDVDVDNAAEYDGDDSTSAALPAGSYFYELWDTDSNLLLAYGDAELLEGSP